MTVIFVCHGNICRSVMAEYIFKYHAKREGLDVDSFSRATSTEEIGNDIYYNAKRELEFHHIPYQRHFATRITKDEALKADLVIVMDSNNYYNLRYLIGDMSNVHYLKEYSVGHGDIEDPWYTRNFTKVFMEIEAGVLGLIEKIKEQ